MRRDLDRLAEAEATASGSTPFPVEVSAALPPRCPHRLKANTRWLSGATTSVLELDLEARIVRAETMDPPDAWLLAKLRAESESAGYVRLARQPGPPG